MSSQTTIVVASKNEWLTRLQVLDQLDTEVLSDELIRASWQALHKIRPIREEVRDTSRTLAKKYTMKDSSGDVATKQSLRENLVDANPEGEGQEEADEALAQLLESHGTVRTKEGVIVLEDDEAYESAIEETLEEDVEVEVRQVSLQDAMSSEVGLTTLHEALGWLICTGSGK